jgi:site-specific recombinase XerC
VIRKTLDKSTTYEVRRYLTPSPIPASQAASCKVRARRNRVTEPITYQSLFEIHERLLAQGALKPQTAANRASALRSFLRFAKVHIDDPVGDEFRMKFPARTSEFATQLVEDGRSPRNVSNTLAALRPWRDLVVAMDTERAIAGDNLGPFNAAFRRLIEGHPVKAIARQTGAPPAMLYGWLQGKRPRLSNEKYIRRIEMHFGVESGELASLAGFKGGQRALVTAGDPLTVPYREELAARTQFHFMFKPASTSCLREQWGDLLRYKTELEPVLARNDNGVWRLAPMDFKAERESSWAAFLDGCEVPSASYAWHHVASYLGWLQLPASEGGAALASNELDTLAWFAVKERLAGYIRWVVKRNKNVYSGGIFTFIGFVASLLRPGSGYLYQQASFGSHLPPRHQGTKWEEMCLDSLSLLTSTSARFRKSRQPTRDPRAPMRHILEAPNPLDFIADMVLRLRADRPVGGAPTREAIWARDVALVKVLTSNPLRLRNVSTLTWRADNTGQLYQRGDGSWWISIDKRLFKNTDGAAGDNEYDMPVQKSAWADVERYLVKFRPVLKRCETDFVFLSAKTYRRDRPGQPWTDLSTRIRDLTKRYLWRSPGIGVQAFRHVIATSIIKASGNRDFKTAALVLNDRLATVEKNYAHLRSADGANRMAELLGGTFDRM